MGAVRTSRSSSRWIAALLLTAVVTTAMVAQRDIRSRAVDAGAVVPLDRLALNVVYLADTTQPRLDEALARRAGVQLVVSAPDLQRLGGQADGIMIDRALFATVDREWLVAQRQGGKLIVGIDIPFSQLEGATGFPPHSPPPSYAEDWSGQAFYSLLWRVERGGRSRSATASDRLPDTTALLGMVGAQLGHLREARVGVTTIQPPPRDAPIRPGPSTR